MSSKRGGLEVQASEGQGDDPEFLGCDKEDRKPGRIIFWLVLTAFVTYLIFESIVQIKVVYIDSATSSIDFYGPNFWQQFEDPPGVCIFFWITSVLLLAFNWHYANIVKEAVDKFKPETELAFNYRTVVLLPFRLGILFTVSLFWQRMGPFVAILRRILEAWTILNFVQAIEKLVAIQSGAGKGYGAITQHKQEMAETIRRLPKVKFWTHPPIGCLFRYCERKRKVEMWQFKLARVLVEQYVVVVPFSQALVLIMTASDQASGRDIGPIVLWRNAILTWIWLFAVLFASWGLNMFHKTTADALKDYNLKTKFFYMKALMWFTQPNTWMMDPLALHVMGDERNVPLYYNNRAKKMLFNNFMGAFEAAIISYIGFHVLKDQAREIQWVHNLRTIGYKTEEEALAAKNQGVEPQSPVEHDDNEAILEFRKGVTSSKANL